jgi:serine phosphatase RsbU (regulator of sigma subunit)
MPTRFRFRLPAPRSAPADGVWGRLRAFARTFAGRVLIAALVVWGLDEAGVPMPEAVRVLDSILLFVFGAWALFRFGRYLVRSLLWRIRSKLLVSYLFIAVVPLVLLTTFFVLAGFLGLSLVASYMVSSQIERTAQDLLTVAKASLADLRLDGAQLDRALGERLASARAVHPKITYALVRGGRKLTGDGDATPTLPAWLKGPGFAGLVKRGEEETIRSVWQQGDTFLVLDAPLDDDLFAELKKRTGIGVVDTGGRVEKKTAGIEVHIGKAEERRFEEKIDAEAGGPVFFSVAERTDWETGKTDLKPMGIRYSPQALVRRLSPASMDIGDALVKGLVVVGATFLVVYCVALVLGLLLARSITRSIHGLSVGTQRLRQGDFSHPIPIHSRDQLGELAESFNVMAHGIQDLLREQAEKERLEEELRIARQIQMSLLPQGTVGLPGLRIAALCLPAAEVGGDYYDLLPLSDTKMGVLVADVSGKGTSAALYMAELKGLVLSLSRIYDSPARLLAEANRILAANMDPRSFITMTYAVVDTAARTLRYARAGHNPMIHLEAATGRTHVLAPQGIGLGMDRGDRFEEVLEEKVVPLEQGDVFLFFTDGLSEAMNADAELFGERRLRDVVEAAESVGTAESDDTDDMKERILAAVREFVGEAAQHDDMTMVILKVA